MIAFISAVFFLAGMVKGVIGLGLPTVAMALLTLFISPIQAAAFLLIPSLVTNIWQLFAEGAFLGLLRRFFWLLAALIVGTFWSIFPTLGSDQGYISEILLGSMLILYALYGLFAKNIPDLSKYETYLSPFIGYLSGALIVATGVVIIPVAPYLNSLRLQKNDLVQSLGLVFTISTLCLAWFLYQNPKSTLLTDWHLSIVALIVALVGMWVGQKIRYKISEQKFRRIFFYGLMGLGSYMVIHQFPFS
ncbi:sulfite exporter TauE/SafE family protein [Acinetobacter qingfengensis]|uniref:Probable membrane transporter protein n=1 Tax=Acinetobacter qingfengensis TaxID=1262585 RepID=A0A1E7R579_9GAMM|nr:sulfite exporter TauE/SafE family protein [Acinetobacter qingfengensis]KAA8730917.1 sulfite exporter TauE/SafE family protein [Acinetobacter qingfengensis]OEY94484.1 hypothetical protein BJI46_03870 [Acinetobacter qingfengensis]